MNRGAELCQRGVAVVRTLLTGLPLWVRQTAALLAVYALVMTIVTLWMPWHDLDAALYTRMPHPRELASNITLVDVQPAADDPLATRRLITTFLNRLSASKQQPKAVILDFTFDPCETPCVEPFSSVRAALIAAISKAKAPRLYDVYAIENLTAQSTDPYGAEVSGTLEDDDPVIYGPHGLAGSGGHSIIHIAETSGLIFYHACYRNIRMPPDRGLAHAEDIWSIAWRVQPTFNANTCDTSDVPFFVGPPIPLEGRGSYTTIPHKPPGYYAITQTSPFSNGIALDDQYVILGTLELDTLEKSIHLAGTEAGAVWERLHGAGSLNIPGSELLAWEISDKLEQQAAGASTQTYVGTRPFDRFLYFLVPAFSATTVLAFTACFLFLKRLRLQSARRFLPWIGSALALCVGFVFFAATELVIHSYSHENQPQTTLISLGILLSAGLSGVRGTQMMTDIALPDEKYDYDVFVSYAHDDLPWVLEHIVGPLRKARLRNGDELSIFFDKSSLYNGDWRKNLTLALLNCRHVIPIYSGQYFRQGGKGYCIFELDCAYDRWIQIGKAAHYLLPIMYGNVQIPPEYGQAQFIRFDENPGIVEQHITLIVDELSAERT